MRKLSAKQTAARALALAAASIPVTAEIETAAVATSDAIAAATALPVSDTPANDSAGTSDATIGDGNIPVSPLAADLLASGAVIAKPRGNIARTANVISRNATNYGGVLSDRDNAYIEFYSRIAKMHETGVFTLADIRAIADFNPYYNGSAKSFDAGAINRLRKANVLTVSADGTELAFTDYGKAQKLYALAVAYPSA